MVVSATAMVSVGLAAIGDGGTIKTCSSKSQGTWRPIDTAGNCKSGETALEFYSKAGADSTFLGKTAKAADADKLDGLDSTAFAQLTDGKVADADKLDGIDSSGFLGATAKAADSDKLDGIDSSGLVQGAGRRTSYRLADGLSTFRDTSAAAIFVGCQDNGTYLLTVDGAPGSTAFWIDDGGSITRFDTALVHVVFNGANGFGDRHVMVRAMSSSATTQWDMTFSGNAVDSCLISVLEDVSPLTAVQ